MGVRSFLFLLLILEVSSPLMTLASTHELNDCVAPLSKILPSRRRKIAQTFEEQIKSEFSRELIKRSRSWLGKPSELAQFEILFQQRALNEIDERLKKLRKTEPEPQDRSNYPKLAQKFIQDLFLDLAPEKNLWKFLAPDLQTFYEKWNDAEKIAFERIIPIVGRRIKASAPAVEINEIQNLFANAGPDIEKIIVREIEQYGNPQTTSQLNAQKNRLAESILKKIPYYNSESFERFSRLYEICQGSHFHLQNLQNLYRSFRSSGAVANLRIPLKEFENRFETALLPFMPRIAAANSLEFEGFTEKEIARGLFGLGLSQTLDFSPEFSKLTDQLSSSELIFYGNFILHFNVQVRAKAAQWTRDSDLRQKYQQGIFEKTSKKFLSIFRTQMQEKNTSLEQKIQNLTQFLFKDVIDLKHESSLADPDLEKLRNKILSTLPEAAELFGATILRLDKTIEDRLNLTLGLREGKEFQSNKIILQKQIPDLLEKAFEKLKPKFLKRHSSDSSVSQSHLRSLIDYVTKHLLLTADEKLRLKDLNLRSLPNGDWLIGPRNRKRRHLLVSLRETAKSQDLKKFSPADRFKKFHRDFFGFNFLEKTPTDKNPQFYDDDLGVLRPTDKFSKRETNKIFKSYLKIRVELVRFLTTKSNFKDRLSFYLEHQKLEQDEVPKYQAASQLLLELTEIKKDSLWPMALENRLKNTMVKSVYLEKIVHELLKEDLHGDDPPQKLIRLFANYQNTRTKILKSMITLVPWFIQRHYFHISESNRSDAVQIGGMVILYAMDRYDLKRGNFSTLVFRSLRNKLERQFPRRIENQGPRPFLETDLRSSEDGDTASNFWKNQKAEDPKFELERLDDIESLLKIIETIPEKCAFAIKHYYGIGTEPMSQSEIGRLRRVGKQSVSIWIQAGLDAIRKKISQGSDSSMKISAN